MPLILRESRQEATPFDQLQAPTSEVFTTSVEEAFDDNPATKLFANAKLNLMESHGASPRLSKEEVADLAKQNGVELKDIPENGYKKEAAQYLIDRQYEKKKRQVVLSTAESTFMNNAAQFGGGLVGSLVDPLNIASGFIPVVGQAKYLKMLQGASGALGRAGVRAGVGALEGAVGAVALEPLNYMASKNLQDDYTLANSAVNIAFGASMGAALHSVGGFVGDRLKISDYAKSPKPDAVPHPVDKIVEMPKEAKAEIESVAARHVLDDNPVEIWAMVDWEVTKASVNREEKLALARTLEPELFGEIDRVSQELRDLETQALKTEEAKLKSDLTSKLAKDEAPIQKQLDYIQQTLDDYNKGKVELTADEWHNLTQNEAAILSKYDFSAAEKRGNFDTTELKTKIAEKEKALYELKEKARDAFILADSELRSNKQLVGTYPGRTTLESVKARSAQSVKESLERLPNQRFLDEDAFKAHAAEYESLKAEVGETADPESAIANETAMYQGELESTLEKMGKKEDMETIREEAKGERAKYSDYEKAIKAMADCVRRNG